MPVRHIVIWKLLDPANAPRFKARLEECASLVPGTLEFQVGLRQPELESNADVVLVSTFASKEALDAYLVHPHHKAVAAELATLREQRHAVDYEVK